MSSSFNNSITGTDTLFASAFHYAAIGMALVAPDGRWLKVNRALCQLIGYDEEELLSMTFQDITHPDDLEVDLAHINRMLHGEIDSYQLEKRYFHRNGNVIYILLSVSLVSDGDGTPLFLISQIQDITERKHLERELFKQATEDSLTGASNRRQFFSFANRELARASRYHEPIVLLMIDIDHFKAINDNHGHDVGDTVLREMAAICKTTLRSSDLFARLGGEEFAVLLLNTDPQEGQRIAERLRAMIAGMKVDAGEESLGCTVSIGAIAFAGGTETLEQRLKQADNALYEAKRGGRNRVRLYSEPAAQGRLLDKGLAGFLRFSWKPAYDCGVDLIDRQHRRLFELANELFDCLMFGEDRGQVDQLLSELARHVRVHFADEERILASRGYPEVAEHGRLHGQLLKKMALLFDGYRQGGLSVEELFAAMAGEVISRHLLDEDVKFFPYLR